MQGRCGTAIEGARSGAGTSSRTMKTSFGTALFLLRVKGGARGFVSGDRFFIVGCSFSFFKSDSSRRAFGKTVSHAVAVIVADEFRFAVYHGDSAFVTGGRAGAAAVAFFPIDMNDLPFHNFSVKVFVLINKRF